MSGAFLVVSYTQVTSRCWFSENDLVCRRGGDLKVWWF
ncbi:hypothetical protein VIBHAR_05497 [Vibrio campbellii ATCC BAA-1116]|uniref:Uncharacterized protein n=1 Tax=Vibrio campbellii (strain ATCC BAA-1116) TaxID=2902295 RepID=A7N2K9_VIBC1|nr:hypothetical protein VIBHAR_05497 [Vibrio campbellii ATCC BAA-1116]